MAEYIYYGKKIGAPNYEEEIILQMARPLTLAERIKVYELLAQNGKEYVRVFVYNGEAPDFAGTVNI